MFYHLLQNWTIRKRFGPNLICPIFNFLISLFYLNLTLIICQFKFKWTTRKPHMRGTSAIYIQRPMPSDRRHTPLLGKYFPIYQYISIPALLLLILTHLIRYFKFKIHFPFVCSSANRYGPVLTLNLGFNIFPISSYSSSINSYFISIAQREEHMFSVVGVVNRSGRMCSNSTVCQSTIPSIRLLNNMKIHNGLLMWITAPIWTNIQMSNLSQR